MTCSAFRNRLYDEDWRAVWQAGTPVPRGLERHIAVCVACARAWAEAAADLATLPQALRAGPPPHLRARLLRDADIALTLHDQPALDWRQAVSWAAAGGAVAAGLATVLVAAPFLSQVGVFVLAASMTAGARVVVTPLTGPSSRV